MSSTVTAVKQINRQPAGNLSQSSHVKCERRRSDCDVMCVRESGHIFEALERFYVGIVWLCCDICRNTSFYWAFASHQETVISYRGTDYDAPQRARYVLAHVWEVCRRVLHDRKPIFFSKILEIWNRFNSCQHKSLSHCMSTYTNSAADQQTRRSSHPMCWSAHGIHMGFSSSETLDSNPVFPKNWGKIAPERRKPHMCFWLLTDNMMRCASSSLRMALGQRAVRSFFFNVQLVTTENHKNV